MGACSQTLRTTGDAAAPPKPVRSTISACAMCVRKRVPSDGTSAASRRLFPRAASFCTRCVGLKLFKSGAMRACMSSKLCSAHAHFGTMPRRTFSFNVSAPCPFLSHTGHAAELVRHDLSLQPHRISGAFAIGHRLKLWSVRRQTPHRRTWRTSAKKRRTEDQIHPIKIHP